MSARTHDANFRLERVEKLQPGYSISDERRNKGVAEREADADGGDQEDQAFRPMEMGQSGLQQDVFLFAHLAGISAGVMVTTPGQPQTWHIPGRFGKLTAKSRLPLPESAAFVRN